MKHYFSTLTRENKELQICRPFGPSIGICRLPQELIDDFNKDCDNIVADKEKAKKHDYSAYLAGNVKQELTISEDVWAKWAPYFENLVEVYLAAHPQDAGEFKKQFQSKWYVRSFPGDFNPVHIHTGCQISCVGYLGLPKGIEKEWYKEDDKDYCPSAGNIEMLYGQAQLFSSNTLRLRPAVRDFFIFPWWMHHMVYPFRSKGERRSFSFNVGGR
tara:strand:- start:324 stop:968 length:645 start_codon:yes stop_codon:yes gene_type:complete